MLARINEWQLKFENGVWLTLAVFKEEDSSQVSEK